MKTRTLLIVATLATLIAGTAFANTAAHDAFQTMTVDAVAPMRATLLPLVSIDATPATSESNPARMRVAETAPIEVTLLPTVRVTPTSAASAGADPIAEVDGFASDLPVIDDAAPATIEQPLGLRARAMPR